MCAMKLILWDIDGTLIASQGAGVRAMERACRECFGQTVDLRKIGWAGRTDTWITGEVLRHLGLPDTPEACARYLAAYLALLPEELQRGPSGYVLPGVRELLEILHGRADFVQGLLTGNMREGARHKLGHHGLWEFFAFGAFADDSPRRNDLGPHALRRARDLHGVDFRPEQTWIIGDTPHDIECGKVIGAQTLAVATGHHRVEELAAHSPTALLADLAETTAFLRVIGG